MRSVKVLSFIVMTAAAVSVEAPTVSANTFHVVLCKQAELVCEKPLPNPTTLIGHAVFPKLLSSIGTVECGSSSIELEVLNELFGTIISHLKGLSFAGSCHLGSTLCTVSLETPGLFWVNKSGQLEARVRSTGETQIKVKCGFLINCLYGGEPELNLHSSEFGATRLLANSAELRRSTGFCPENSLWDASYEVLGTMFVES